MIFNSSLLPNIKIYIEFWLFDSANEIIICQHYLYARRKEVLKQLIRNYQNPSFESGESFKCAVLCPIKCDIVFIVEVLLCQKSRKN